MKLYNKIFICLVIFAIIFSLILTFVSGAQPTQQYNKIYLNPFYRSAMTNNLNYSYNISVNPPDKISEVKSAIISYDIYLTPTVTFYMWVNNKSCNTPSYLVHTTYMDASWGRINFDCSNIINQSGNYTITLQPSGASTGAVNGWLDLTYMNNPSGDLELSGTEYSPGDPATIFVQLKDAQGLSVSNGSCYLDIWYPANGSNVHPNALQDAPMLAAEGNHGIYYYDLIAPSQLGVYMLSAKCAYSFNWLWVYGKTEQIYSPVMQNQSGSWLGSTIVLNRNDEMSYLRCDATAGAGCVANFSFDINSYFGSVPNVTTINLYYAGQGDINGKVITFAYWDGTTFVNLPNTLTIISSGASASQVGVTDQYVTNSIPLSAIINGTVKIRYSTPTGLARYYSNWLSIALLTSSGTIQDVKGSSEMHITNQANASLNALLNNTQVAENIWNYSNRSLTYYPDMTNYTQIVNDIWSAASRNLTYFPTQLDLTNYTKVADFVWNYLNRNLTYYNMTDTTNYTQMVYDIWTYGNRNLTYFPTQLDLTNYTLITQNIWTYVDRNLTYFPAGNNITVGDIWNYVNRNLTWFPTQNNITTQDIWTYFNRSLTYFPYNNISSADIWAYVNRNLTYFPTQNNITSGDIWNYFNRSLTEFNFDVVNETQIAESVWSWNGLISGNLLSQLASYFWNWTGSIASNILDLFKLSIWNSPDRNLTYYNNSQQVDLTNYSKISEFVWNNTNRNLTYFPTFPIQSDLTNYSLIAEQVWVYNNRNLTFYNNTQQLDLTNYSQITQDVWNYLNRTLTYYNNSQQYDLTNYTTIVQDVWSYVNRNLTYYNNSQQLDLTNYSLITQDVWNYLNRNLTYFPTQQDLTNYTFVIEGVWNYMNRSLSDYNQSDLTNYTKITEDVWNYFNRTLTDYNSTSQLDLTNYTKITNDVWNFIARNLTYYPDMTNYTKISYGVWNWYNRTLFYNVTGEETSSSGYGKLPLSTINIITPDPFYFDVDYELIYDPVDMKGKTVEITKFSVKLLENITYELNNPVIMADGRYKQTIKIPLQDIDTFTLSVNATQRYVNSNQKFYINVERQRSGITGFTISDSGKRGLMYLGGILLFLLFLIMVLAVVNKKRKNH